MDTTLIVIIVLLVAAVQVALVWAIFNMRNHIEKQTTILIAVVRLLSKVAHNTGSDKEEVKTLLYDLERRL